MLHSPKLSEIIVDLPDCISVNASMPLLQAMEKMQKNKVTGLVVVEGSCPIGILTEHDLMKVIAGGVSPDTQIVGSAMTSPVVSVSYQLDFFEAYHVCVQKNIRHLVVLDEAGELFGMASESDFLRALGMDVMANFHMVEDCMTQIPLLLPPDITTIEALRRINLDKGRAGIIIKDGKPVGILTERDILHLGLSQSDLNRPLETVMISPILTVLHSATIYFAIDLMRNHKIRRLVVVDEEGLAVGLLGEHDIVKQIDNRYVDFLTSVINKQRTDINYARKQLNESVVLTSILDESLDIGVVATDIEGTVQYLNPEAEKLIGFDSESAKGKNMINLARQSGLGEEHINSGMKAASSGERYLFESLTHKNYVNQLIRGRIAPIHDDKYEHLGYVHTLKDITAHKEAEIKLRQAASIFDNTVEGVMVTNSLGDILSVNPGFTNITGYSEDEVVGKNPRILSSGRQNKAFYQRMWKHVVDSGYWQGEIWNRRKNGEMYAEWLTLNTVLNDEGLVKNYIGVFSDITSLKKSQEDFEYKAHHDTLTQLPNRLLLKARMEHALVRSVRSEELIAILFIDLDGFKPVNDLHGHPKGDILLQMVAERLLKNVRGADTVSRWGGDEFVIMLEDIKREGVAAIAQKLNQEISKPYDIDGCSISVSSSIGIAFSSDKITADQTINNADNALYQVKNSGRNNYKFYDE